MKCPNGCEITEGVVCGGGTPHFNHGNTDPDVPNVYFYMDLASGELTRKLFSKLDFELTEQDWADMHDHAEGGCCDEGQCPVCLEYLK